MVAYVVALSVLLGIVASAAFADRVYCRPIIRKDVVRRVCFIVCNLPGPNDDPCTMQGCIYDVHIRIGTTNCLFTKVISLPKYWTGVIPAPVPGPVFEAETPCDAAGAASNPIKIGYCYRFCVGVTPRCLSPGECFWFRWITTGCDHVRRQAGGGKCCFPKPAGT